MIPNNVLFDFVSDVITPAGRSAITSLLPRIRSASRTDVVGHADSVGQDSYNQGLSERRARAVVREIGRQDPSLVGRLSASGRGEREPRATNDTEAGRAQNRRVELHFRP